MSGLISLGRSIRCFVVITKNRPDQSGSSRPCRVFLDGSAKEMFSRKDEDVRQRTQ